MAMHSTAIEQSRDYKAIRQTKKKQITVFAVYRERIITQGHSVL